MNEMIPDLTPLHDWWWRTGWFYHLALIFAIGFLNYLTRNKNKR